VQDVQTFPLRLFSNLHIETLIYGNASKEDAIQLSRIVQEKFDAKPVDIESLERTRSLLLPAGNAIARAVVDMTRDESYSERNHTKS
jgi:secreted Zn-dependent insulinase-like peptidase